jgi:hypothetical protein
MSFGKKNKLEVERSDWIRIQSKFCLFCRVALAQLVRFLVVELTHSDSNPGFDMSITFTTNYSFSGR